MNVLLQAFFMFLFFAKIMEYFDSREKCSFSEHDNLLYEKEERTESIQFRFSVTVK